MTEVTAPALAGHPFLRGMPPGQLDALAAAASDVTFPAGHRVFDGHRVFEEGGFAGKFWLIQSGHVALDVHVPGSGRVIIDSIGIGDLLGCSWLFPPYRWAFGAACITAVRAFEFDAAAIRERCAGDPEFGAEFRERLLRVLARRLQGTMTRLIAGSMSDGA
ncbi:MAG: cyclic nucleotide-binding domain-containing protein [Trebonia sp.]|uniref:cyclic nucleotide-binding domain-containing protein n=1 Tax=Trebonia sp. TaxID=2767075 RepID=UPI003BB1782E